MANGHDIRGPGTPTWEEEGEASAGEAGLAALAAVASDPAAVAIVAAAVEGGSAAVGGQGVYDLNSQSIAGIAFFVALNCYQNRVSHFL